MKTANQTKASRAIDMELKSILKKDIARYQKQITQAQNKTAA